MSCLQLEFIRILRAGGVSLGVQAGLDRAQELWDPKRLEQETAGIGSPIGEPLTNAGYEKDPRIGMPAPDSLDHLDAVDAGHRDVGDDQVDMLRVFGKELDPLFSTFRCQDGIPML